ncbi:hypothetical protein LWI29_034376 [Acer saccharum]|uniref:AAA+ ATPase domain-containing protein n=1 Tax=Acer saccharum TaxID=4024 RepID=A0AA39REV1_ACESA|nr:hypothetical protein LWI29_034376 [Acer saccharum]
MSDVKRWCSGLFFNVVVVQQQPPPSWKTTVLIMTVKKLLMTLHKTQIYSDIICTMLKLLFRENPTAFLTEDGLFDIIRASNHGKARAQGESKKSEEKVSTSLPKQSPQKTEVKSNSSATKVARKITTSVSSPAKRKDQNIHHSLPWTEKYRPKVPNEIVGNQSLINQLHNWLAHWNEQFLNTGTKQNGKKQNDPSAKKAVLLSGGPGMGKTTSAKLVNASDSCGKADAKISKGIGGSNANSIKELVSNESLSAKMDRSKHPKTVLIMDEVDGMSAGDRGGVADLIASIKISKIPIICICNDRYSQKLKSLVNYCLLLSFRKPTKQQMAKRLMQIANAESLQINEIALEELAERVNGDMRMALNQLQYMNLSMSVIKYDDIRKHLLSSAKDEDISPFTAVDKLLGFNGGKLRMDERIDLSMSDPDLVPLLVQENYINYRPSSAGKDEMKRMNLIARAAESIADGDIVNVQIRRYRQWQLSQTGSLASCIIPAALLHGQRETLEQGHPNPLEGIPPPVKSALTRAYNEGSKSRMVRAADLVTLPGIKKAPKKRIAAILEPSDDKIGEENGDVLAGSDEENSSDTEDQCDDATKSEKLQTELQSLNSKGVQVQLELKETKNSSAKKKPAGRGKGGSAASASSEKKGGVVLQCGGGAAAATAFMEDDDVDHDIDIDDEIAIVHNFIHTCHDFLIVPHSIDVVKKIGNEMDLKPFPVPDSEPKKKMMKESTAFLTEDGLFDIIRASNHGKARAQGESKKSEEKVYTSLPKQSPRKTEVKSRPQITHIDLVALFLIFDSLK